MEPRGMKFAAIGEKFLGDFNVAFQWLQDLGLLFDRSGRCCECHKGKVALDDCAVQDGKRWRCYNRKCRKAWTFRKDSWFEGSHLSIPKILEMTYLWVYEYPNKAIKEEIGTSVTTITEWSNACRDVCMATVLETYQETAIGGVGRIVEIDESVFRGCKYLKRDIDCCKQGSCLFGGIDRISKEYFFRIVPDLSAATLIPILQKHVKPGTTIVASCSRGKSSLQDLNESSFLELDFTFQVAKCSSSSYSKGSSQYTSALALSDYSRRRHQHNSYFIEYVVREHFLKTADDPFLAFIKLIAKAYRRMNPVKAEDARACASHLLLVDHPYANIEAP